MKKHIYRYIYIYEPLCCTAEIKHKFANQLYFLVAQMVKNLPTMQKIWIRSLGQEDLLEKGMATHSSFLAWRIPWTEEPGGLQSVGSQSQTRLRACVTYFILQYVLMCLIHHKG